MSAVAWATVRDAIQGWVKNSSGLAGDHVIWSGQSTTRPAGPYVELKLRVLPHRGIDPVRYTHDGGSPGTLTQRIYAARALELQMTCWQGAPQTSAGSSVPATSSWPVQIIDDVLCASRLDSYSDPAVTTSLAAAGIGIGANEVVALDGDVIDDVYFEARCIATVRLHVASETTFVYPTGTGWIQIVNAAGLPGDLQSIVFTVNS